MDLPHVFAKSSASVPMPDGNSVAVPGGSHWLADDPVVKLRPDLFTVDCRYGLAWSGEPPHVLSIPPGEDDPVMAERLRSRSRAERSRPGGPDNPLDGETGEPITRGRPRAAHR